MIYCEKLKIRPNENLKVRLGQLASIARFNNGERIKPDKLRNLRSFREGGELSAKRPCDEIVRPAGWEK
jgi:hypothetical protein